MTRVLMMVIRFYQMTISPITGPHCRFIPSCSSYALEALGKYGCWRGGWLSFRRLIRCHPFGGRGLDPVP